MVGPFNIFKRSLRAVIVKKERKEEKETLSPHVNIKKKRSQPIAPLPDGRAQLTNPAQSREAWGLAACTSRKSEL